MYAVYACQLSRRALAGHQYLQYEPQRCPRNPGARRFGRVNSGSWFEAAQYRANQLTAATGGRGTKCAAAGLVWVSDTSFGGKNTPWHGVYGAYKAYNLSGCSSGMCVIQCNACKASVMHVIKLLHALHNITQFYMNYMLLQF